MHIFVRTLSGLSVMLDVEPRMTVKQAAAKIQVQEGIPSDQPVLIFGCQLLEPRRKLSEYNIQIDSTLQLAFKLSAGGTTTDGTQFESYTYMAMIRDGKKVPYMSGNTRIFIRVPSCVSRDDPIEIWASDIDTINEIKANIQDLCRHAVLPFDEMTLWYDRTCLIDDNTLSHYWLPKDGHLNTILTLQLCAYNPRNSWNAPLLDLAKEQGALR